MKCLLTGNFRKTIQASDFMDRRHVRVLVWSVILAPGGFLFGFDTAVIPGVEKKIQALFDLSPFWHSFTIASALIGTVAGPLFTGGPADRYGRKPVLFVIAFLFFYIIYRERPGQGHSLGSFTPWLFAAIITFACPVVVGQGHH